MHVSQIFIHPVKSLKGVEVKESMIDDYGFKYDRLYTLATVSKSDDDPWVTFNQRHEPRLVLVNTAIENDSIVVSYSGRELRLPTDPSKVFIKEPTVSLNMYGNICECFDITDKYDIASVFSEVIEPKVLPSIRLLAPKVRRTIGEAPSFPPESRSAWEEFSKSVPRNMQSSFQDLFPCHFVTSASLEALQLHLESGPDQNYNVAPQNFRPNIVIENEDPWVEDDWESLKIGSHEWFLMLSTPRCAITTVDTKEGKYRKSKEPHTSLGKFRVLEKGGGPCFGRYMAHRDPNTVVRVGDPIEVLSLRPDALSA